MQGFLLSSSYGLSGWVLAKDVRIERDTPLRSEIVRCVLPLIHDWRAGLDIHALVGDVISADSRSNIWFASQKAISKLNEDEWLDMLTALETVATDCRAAVLEFVQGGDRQALLHALGSVAERLNVRPDFE